MKGLKLDSKLDFNIVNPTSSFEPLETKQIYFKLLSL